LIPVSRGGRRPVARPSAAAARGRRIATPYLLLLPAGAMYAVFTVYPLFRQFDISFYNWHIFPGASNPFTGLSNYSQVLHDPVVRTAALNTLLYTVITVPAQMIVSYIFAYLFNAQDGLANSVASLLAGHAMHIDWLAQTWTGNAVIWLVGIWKGVGWSFVIFLAALDGMPRDLVEAGRIDGASEPVLWRKVIIPSIRPAIVFVLVLLVIGASQVFTQVYLMTQGGPYDSTQVLYTWAYQQAFTNFEFSYAAALASLIAVVVLALSVAEVQVLRRNPGG
jgi:multiple sugar transport system permease protein